MKRSFVAILAVLALSALLPVTAANAGDRPYLEYTWSSYTKLYGEKIGRVKQNQYLTLYFRWRHSSGQQMAVTTKIKISDWQGRRVGLWNADSMSDTGSWSRLRFKAKWPKGQFDVRLYGRDSAGQRSSPFPTIEFFWIK